MRRFVSRFFVRQQDIEDIVQETFLRAFDAEQVRSVRTPKAFLFQIARNIALKELTRKSRRITDYIEESDAEAIESADPPVEHQVETRQHLDRLCRVVATLPPQCRRAFVMCKVYGLSHAEIAARLGITVKTVEKHIAVGLLRCSAAMRRHESALPAVTLGTDPKRRIEASRD